MLEESSGIRGSIWWTLEAPHKYFIGSLGLIAGSKDIDKRGLQKGGILTQSYFGFVYLEKNILYIFVLTKLLSLMYNFGDCSRGQLPGDAFGSSAKFALFFNSE